MIDFVRTMRPQMSMVSCAMSVDTSKIITFLLAARTKTYAGSGGKVTPALEGSKQLEYAEGEWLYRDIYNLGQGLFMGFETIYFQNEAVWSMAYFGDFTQMTEEEIDRILRVALIAKQDTARLWQRVTHTVEEYEYICEGTGSMEKMKGDEIVKKADHQVYFFQYAGGYIGK